MEKKRITDAIYSFIVQLPDEEWNRLSIKWLAGRFGVSRCYLSRAFRSDMKLTLGAFIHVQKLRRAERLLALAQRMTVKELAERVGFCDYQYFISCFKQYWGQTPNRYRMLIRTASLSTPEEADRRRLGY